MNRSVVAGFAMLGAVVVSTSAMAEEAKSPISANVALTSNYKFRGQDQDQIGANGFYKKKAFKPALQGGFDYEHDSGFYVGNWNSTVNWLDGNKVESDLYGGYKFKAGPVDMDVGVITYIYPGNKNGNTTEIYAGLSWADDAIGEFGLKYSHTVSKDYFGYAGANSWSWYLDPWTKRPSGRNTGYINFSYSKEVAPNLTLSAAVGYTRMSSDIRRSGYKNYIDYNVGASYDFGGGLTLSGSVQGANKKSSYMATTADGIDWFGDGSFIYGASAQSVNKARFILTLAKSF